MALKICHNDEIHKISKAPSSLSDLRTKISSVFRDSIPSNYRLEYIDSDGDRITISNEESFNEVIHAELPGPQKAIKIYVVPVNKASGPIHIQNKEEFAKELPKPGPKTAETRLGKEEAPSDESLPSSDEDHEEKIQGINEAVEDLKRQGKVNLQPKIYENVGFEKEKKKGDKKKDKRDDESLEKKQEKIKKVLEKMRKKDLTEEKKTKLAKKLMKYKDSLAEKQQERGLKQQQQQAQSRPTIESRNPIELMMSQIMEKMVPEINRLSGGLIHPFTSSTKRERSSEDTEPHQKVTHPRIICDGCGMRPIVGTRYKCTLCPNFDYCENCEERMGHSHPFVKIRTPQQDYFSPGFMLEAANRRQNAGRVMSDKDDAHHDFFEPAYGFGSMWPGRAGGSGHEHVSYHGQRDHRAGKDKTLQQRSNVQQQQQQHQQQQRHQYQQHFPQHHQQQQQSQYQQQQQQAQQPRYEEQNIQREKENQGFDKRDKRDEVEIEDESYDKVLAGREANELRQKQDQIWVSAGKGDDLKGLEKGKKQKDKGDVKVKAGKLKKEFPYVETDTLIRFVKEAPQDLTMDELVNNFLSWK